MFCAIRLFEPLRVQIQTLVTHRCQQKFIERPDSRHDHTENKVFLSSSWQDHQDDTPKTKSKNQQDPQEKPFKALSKLNEAAQCGLTDKSRRQLRQSMQ